MTTNLWGMAGDLRGARRKWSEGEKPKSKGNFGNTNMRGWILKVLSHWQTKNFDLFWMQTRYYFFFW